MEESQKSAGPGRSEFEKEVLVLLPDLLRGARHMTANHADAEDVVAEAVARAWEHRDSLRKRERFRGWLFRILRNCCLSRRRKERARPEEVPLPVEGDEDASFSLFDRLHQPFLLWWGNPEASFLNELLKEDLEEAVHALPEDYRTVVILSDVQGFTYAEIAEALDIPVGTVRSRLSRARSRLQKNLWNHAVDAGLREPGPRTRTRNR
jgi:RNA polymerase sigma-70 factor, ECF subfamily